MQWETPLFVAFGVFISFLIGLHNLDNRARIPLWPIVRGRLGAVIPALMSQVAVGTIVFWVCLRWDLVKELCSDTVGLRFAPILVGIFLFYLLPVISNVIEQNLSFQVPPRFWLKVINLIDPFRIRFQDEIQQAIRSECNSIWDIPGSETKAAILFERHKAAIARHEKDPRIVNIRDRDVKLENLIFFFGLHRLTKMMASVWPDERWNGVERRKYDRRHPNGEPYGGKENRVDQPGGRRHTDTLT